MEKIKQKNLFSRTKNFVNDLSFHNIYQLFEFGIPVREGTIFKIRENNFRDIYKPVFFLSTGRCGTEWFSKLLSNNKNLKVYHEAIPNLAEQSKLAYKLLKTDVFNDYEFKIKVLKEIFLAGRETQIRGCYKSNLRYIETNHYLTFFAHALSDLFPSAIFIHIIRHPAEFIRSALRRNWYQVGNLKDSIPIKPINNQYDDKEWDHLNDIQKCAWLWNETNSFIKDFKSTISKDRYYLINLNILNNKNIANMLNFIEIELRQKHIQNNINKKVNIQKTGEFAKYQEWTPVQKKDMLNICGDLANYYEYIL